MQRLYDFVHGTYFTAAILFVIACNAVLIGWESYRADPWVEALLAVCLWTFVVELTLKIAAAVGTRRVREFVSDGWNLFDVVIVGAAFVPAVGPLAPILRVLRVLRVFRVVRAVPELRIIVTVLLRSLVSMKYIALLGGIVLYIYAIIGVELFGSYEPAYATLHEACFTLFRVLTGDNWTDLRYAAAGQPWQWKSTFFHVSWIIVSTFLLINLIVGAVLNNYQDVQAVEARRQRPPVDASDERLRELVDQLSELMREREARQRI